jgi:hypothetical protein
MALTLAEVRASMDSVYERAVQAAVNDGDATLVTVLKPIESQLHIIEGASTLAEQKAGCQQLSAALLVIQHEVFFGGHIGEQDVAETMAERLNDLRVEVAQFGFMGS